MQLISYKDDAGNTYWLAFDPDTPDEASAKELTEIGENGWDVQVRMCDVDLEELVSLKYFLVQYLGK